MADGLVLIGGGGHCHACIDVIESIGLTIKGVLDNNKSSNVLGYKVLGDDDMMNQLVDDSLFLITIGQIKSSATRVKIYQKLSALNVKFATVKASSAIVSKFSAVGKGSIVMHNAIIQANTKVGDNCIINDKALIEHDCSIGNHTHISTGAVINGNCNIGNEVFIGSGSIIGNGVSIADNVIIGAGAVVVKDIVSAGIYIGNPARNREA